MTIMEEPYFMKDEHWYYFDAQKRKYMLTDGAPQEAKESYDEFYKMLEELYEEGD